MKPHGYVRYARSAAAALLLLSLPLSAQMSILPAQCAGKTGDALDKCVRDITPPQRSEHVQPVAQQIDPKQMLNCQQVSAADQGLCIARNQLILECRNPKKHADVDKCLAERSANLPNSGVDNCAPMVPQRKAACFQRNKVYKDCLDDKLRYFICLGAKTAKR